MVKTRKGGSNERNKTQETNLFIEAIKICSPSYENPFLGLSNDESKKFDHDEGKDFYIVCNTY
jgi:hypothetical protein